jgi:hypothetical protein
MKSASVNMNATTSNRRRPAECPQKRFLTLGAVLGLLVCGIGVANSANILVNPNLDETSISTQNNPTPNGWVVEGFKTISGAHFDVASSEPWCNVADSGGYGLFFKPFVGDAAAGDLVSAFLYQDHAATPATKFTLSGYAAGEPNYSGFFTTNSPAPQTQFFINFLDASGTVISSNAFDLIAAGLPSGGPSSMSSFQYTSPEVTAPANTATVRAGVAMLNAYSTSGGQSFFVDAFVLDAIAPPGSPVITNQPVQASVAPGGTATFTVGVSNVAGVTYQWQHANTNISDGGSISGANTATLKITGVSAADVGHYRVLVSNGAGSVYSSDVTLTLVGIGMYPVVSITGKIGDTYRIDYATALAPDNWIPLATNKLTVTPYRYIDTSYPQDNARFYRAVYLY